ncbi:MAG: hypothetical protein WAV41_00065 [Microgenomates group bacterium]
MTLKDVLKKARAEAESLHSDVYPVAQQVFNNIGEANQAAVAPQPLKMRQKAIIITKSTTGPVFEHPINN